MVSVSAFHSECPTHCCRLPDLWSDDLFGVGPSSVVRRRRRRRRRHSHFYLFFEQAYLSENVYKNTNEIF